MSDGKVFVIDDDEAVRRSLDWSLSAEGLTAQCFESVGLFLRAYPEEPTGVLLLDLRLPGISGLELIEDMVRRGWHLPTIVITGFGEVPTAVRAMKCGVIDFLQKPYDPAELIKRVRLALQRAKQRHERRAAELAIQQRRASLTQREREVMELVVEGAPNREIAQRMGLSVKTVEVHRSRVMRKMLAPSLADLVRMVMQNQSEVVGSCVDGPGRSSPSNRV